MSFLIVKILSFYALYVLLVTIQNFSNSGFEGSFDIIGRDEKGNIKIGHISGKKTVPRHVPMNLFSVEMGLDKDSRSITYGRRIFGLGNIHFYGTAGVTSMEDERHASVGVTVTF